MLTDVAIRSYEPGLEHEILDCMRLCFHFEPDPERWRHLHIHNPAGKSVIMLASEKRAVVSHVSFLPRRILAFGREGFAGHFVDSMTHPRWRKRGIKTRLSGELRRIAQERNFFVTFSFANEQNLPGLVKYSGRRVVGTLPMLVRPLRPVRSALCLAGMWLHRALAGRIPEADPLPPDSAVAGPIPDSPRRPLDISSPPPGWSRPAFGDCHTELFREAEALPPIAMVRDAAHLTWRYADAPGAPYLQRDVFADSLLQATVVIRQAEAFGLRLVFVMEWFWRVKARDAGRRLMREVIYLARSIDAHGVAALAMPGTSQRRLLHRLGFVGVPSFLLPKSPKLNICPEIDKHDPARWFRLSNWYLSWGDGFIL